MRRLLGSLLLAWLTAGGAQAQITPRLSAVPGPPRPVLEPAADGISPIRALATPGGAFAASLLIPGAGQAALGLRRWVVYGGLEVAFWAVHLEAAADVRSLSRAYKDLAWEVARQPTSPAFREDGPWDYYEDMSHYVASGAYDLDPQTAGTQPETDAATFNGSVWQLAQGLFLPPGPPDATSPEYELAVGYYQARAAGPNFLWTWAGQPGALDRFRGLIQDADGEARVRSTALGLVLANHLISAVDALLVARLRDGAPPARLESRLTQAPDVLRWSIGLRIPIPE
jgi:hypothetical protein